MKDARPNFPLPLSSTTGAARKPGTPSPVFTPQTATRNAASGSMAPPAPGPGARAPGYVPAATGAPTAQRSDLAATEAVRRAMVTRIARQGVNDPQVLRAMEIVPRHLFLEPAMSGQAYVDASLPIGHQQTISQPYIVARMIDILCAGRKLDRVLEIGTGCGYQAAVLSFVAKDVYSIERIKPLHELAKTNLRPMRISNLRLQYGDGMLGLPQVAPFDGIILAAAGLEVPRALLEQLAIGAHLVAPIGAEVQHLHRITRTGKAEWTSETLEACHFVPLRPGTI
ncbi:protein-L-isoaspartate(D-aspartate) O-methyltransferase [Oxalobacteraceae sp. CFBP 13730]|jgi:protein-L-isoaspartate(D-aspartate) O-methyltransferase|nr:protein-L-isoaspartate(D-aspartate) O-methyltransferase [Oxalobacteraceae sp. CFBP 13730]